MENLDLPGNSPEQQPIRPEDVASTMDSEGIDSSEALNLMARYIDQCQAEADLEVVRSGGDRAVANRANLKMAIKVSRVYIETARYKNHARESLEVELHVALQSSSTYDLANEIRGLIAQVTKLEVDSDEKGHMGLSA